MSSAIVIVLICVVFLLSYFFDLSSKFTRVPSVIFLMAMGFGIAFFCKRSGIPLLDLQSVLPIIGTLGLILIILNESFELELRKEGLPMMKKSFIVAIIPMLVLCGVLTGFFVYFANAHWQIAVVNSLPLAIISSAIAIPSVHLLRKQLKDFVVYESSTSDIFGVVLFNFFALNTVFNSTTVVNFFGQIILMVIISLVASAFLSFLLSRIDQHVKFVPIVVLVILIYELAKIFHLPALIFILLFGLFLGNLDQIKDQKIKDFLKPEILDGEIKNLKKIVSEGTFLIRTLFFVVFGYLIELDKLLNPETFIWSLGIVGAIFIVRAIQLRIIKVPLMPLVFVAPRGLITILLFLSIPSTMNMPLVNNSLIIQIIILTVFVMMIGMLFHNQHKVHEEPSELLPIQDDFFPPVMLEEIRKDEELKVVDDERLPE